MAKKREQIQAVELPGRVQAALARVCPLVGNCFMVITYYRSDAVFIMLDERSVQPYVLSRIVSQNPDLYFEIKALAPRFIELRIFWSEWLLAHEAQRRFAVMRNPYESNGHTWYFIREDADGTPQ